MLGVNEFLGSDDLMTSLLGYVCSDGSIIQQVCSTTLFALCGYDPQEMNTVSYMSQLENIPASYWGPWFEHRSTTGYSNQAFLGFPHTCLNSSSEQKTNTSVKFLLNWPSVQLCFVENTSLN
jgi:hypothetical protein